MLNGDPTDSNAHLFKQGASGVFSRDGVKIAKSYDTPGYTPAKAQTEMQQAITALGNDGFAGIYDANDGSATGAITAMKNAGINPSSRPTTGSGCRARRHPADPRGRAVHDRLQVGQDRGAGRRAPGRPAGEGRAAAGGSHQ